MKPPRLSICLSLLLVCASGCAKRSQLEGDFRELRFAHKGIQWDAATSVIADVTCDGKTDTVVLGYEKRYVSVAVISGSDKKLMIMTFPIAGDRQDGFCAKPKRIEVSQLDCESDEQALPGCKPDKSCQAFTVIDTECDPFNFYWNSDQKRLNWWRL